MPGAAFHLSIAATDGQNRRYQVIHCTRSLFSDWPKAYNEFSKSALVTSYLPIIQ